MRAFVGFALLAVFFQPWTVKAASCDIYAQDMKALVTQKCTKVTDQVMLGNCLSDVSASMRAELAEYEIGEHLDCEKAVADYMNTIRKFTRQCDIKSYDTADVCMYRMVQAIP
jgi:hypothetical protein